MNLFGYLPLRLMSHFIFENSNCIYWSAILEMLLNLFFISCKMYVFNKNTPSIPLFVGTSRGLSTFVLIFFFLIGFLNI